MVDEDRLLSLCGKMEKLGEISKSAQYGSDVLLVACLAELLVEVNEKFKESRAEVPNRTSGLVGEIIQYIGSNLDKKLTLEAIAEQFLIDKYYLSHLFREETGDTLYQYILIKKIAIAKRFLSAGKSVSEACVLAGFNDYNNFIRTFKKVAGMTPGKYVLRN